MSPDRRGERVKIRVRLPSASEARSCKVEKGRNLALKARRTRQRMPFAGDRWSRGCGTGIGLSGHKNQFRCAAPAPPASGRVRKLPRASAPPFPKTGARSPGGGEATCVRVLRTCVEYGGSRAETCCFLDDRPRRWPSAPTRPSGAERPTPTRHHKLEGSPIRKLGQKLQIRRRSLSTRPLPQARGDDRELGGG